MSEDEDRARQEMSSLQADESLAFGNMQELSLVADNTNNPLFLWKALSAWFDVNLVRGKLGSELLPMPQQFQTYLAVTAKRLRDLSEGLDYKRAPEPFGELPRVWESVEIARRRTRTLSAPQATRLALHAFGLRSAWCMDQGYGRTDHPPLRWTPRVSSWGSGGAYDDEEDATGFHG